MIEFRLRPAAPQDARLIRDLIHRVQINPMGLHWEHFIVAEDSAGRFIGCGQIKHHGDGSLELASLAVEEAYRGNGIAAAIIQALMTNSPRPLYLMCRPELDIFYKKFGFQAVPDRELPTYFRRIKRFIQAVTLLTGDRKSPLIMRIN
jgi:N-acetylglutamate synthase-like GNAT family acetyltransferase